MVWGLSEDSTQSCRTPPRNLYRASLGRSYGFCSTKLLSLRLTAVNPTVGSPLPTTAAAGARDAAAGDANKAATATMQIQTLQASHGRGRRAA